MEGGREWREGGKEGSTWDDKKGKREGEKEKTVKRQKVRDGVVGEETKGRQKEKHSIICTCIEQGVE